MVWHPICVPTNEHGFALSNKEKSPVAIWVMAQNRTTHPNIINAHGVDQLFCCYLRNGHQSKLNERVAPNVQIDCVIRFCNKHLFNTKYHMKYRLLATMIWFECCVWIRFFFYINFGKTERKKHT